jgi:hypothetical protein
MELCWKLAVKHAGIGWKSFHFWGQDVSISLSIQVESNYLFPHLKRNVLWNDFIAV